MLPTLLLAVAAACGDVGSPETGVDPAPAAPSARAASPSASAAEAAEKACSLATPDTSLKNRFCADTGGWEPSGDGFVSTGWIAATVGDLKSRLMTRSRVAPKADGAWEVFLGTDDAMGARFVPEGVAAAPLEEAEGRAVYRGVRESTDAVLVGGETYAEIAYLLHDEKARPEMAWKVELGKGVARLRADGDGGLAFVDAKGAARLRMARPIAIDANGQTRAAAVRWDEEDARLSVSVDPTGLAFPILLDPVIETVLWEKAHVLDLRSGHAMATLGNKVVLFGGKGTKGYFDDTWEWDGLTWTRKAVGGGPSARQNHAMATLGNKVVLFGGNDGTRQNDTWEWDGAAWTQMNPPNPKPVPRGNHAMATLGNKIVLFGGWSNDVFSPTRQDTWEWDGVKWTEKLNQTHPPQRYGHAMATLGSKVILFGGNGPLGFRQNDTWEWDGTNWTLLSPNKKPAVRSDHTLVSSGSKLVLLGGENGNGHLDDTWEWDGVSWTQKAAAPAAVSLNGAAALGGKVVAVGGSSDSGYVRETWDWDGASWTRRAFIGAPPPRQGHAMATYGSKVVLFGGTDTGDASGVMGDTWEWDGTSWIEKTPNSAPKSRWNHAMATRGNKVVLFGGRTNNNISTQDTWEWDGTTWTNLLPAGAKPSTRHGHVMATLGNEVVLFGGTNAGSFVYDTWEWDGAAWTQKTPATSPSVYGNYTMAGLGNKVVLFGGTDAAVLSKATWEWDGANWSKKTPPTSPPGRQQGVMATFGSKTVLFGGTGALGALNDTWEWDGSGWTQRAPATAPTTPRYWFAMAPLGNQAVLFGGVNADDHYDDTWIYRAELAQGSTCSANADCGTGLCVDGVCCDTACGGGDPSDCQACSIAAGAPADGTCAPSTGNACNDGDACTQTDTCQAGVCAGGNPKTCTAQDACHLAGTCDPATGQCSNPNAPNGAACDDGDACTQTDTCTFGLCNGANPVVCAALDACHDAGTCNPLTGVCSNPYNNGPGCGAPVCVTIQRGVLGDVADTMVSAQATNVNTNQGNKTTIIAGDVSGTQRVSLLRYDLSPIPANATITSATAKLFRQFVYGAPNDVEVRLATAPWSELTVTWNSFASSWSAGTLQTFLGDGVVGTAATFDLTNEVAAWVAGTAPNYGIVLRQSGSSRFVNFVANELGDATQAPSLQVCYQ